MDDTTEAFTDPTTEAFTDPTTDRLRDVFESTDSVAGDDIVTTVFLALRPGKPLLVEGEPGAARTELAKVLAAGFDTDFVRFQCYAGLGDESLLTRPEDAEKPDCAPVPSVLREDKGADGRPDETDDTDDTDGTDGTDRTDETVIDRTTLLSRHEPHPTSDRPLPRCWDAVGAAFRRSVFDTAVTEATAALDQLIPCRDGSRARGRRDRVGRRDPDRGGVRRHPRPLVKNSGPRDGRRRRQRRAGVWRRERPRRGDHVAGSTCPAGVLVQPPGSVAHVRTCLPGGGSRAHLGGRSFAFADVPDLEDVGRQLRPHGTARPVGYEHDWRDRRQNQ
jgi:hypothetical protein